MNFETGIYNSKILAEQGEIVYRAVGSRHGQVEQLPIKFLSNQNVEILMSFYNQLSRGVSKGGAGGAIAPPLFGTIEGAAGDGATPHYYLYYLPPNFKKLLTPLCLVF